MFEGNSDKVVPIPDNMSAMPNRIVISIIEQKAQRYPTVGDWRPSKQIGEFLISVSKMKDSRYEMLVAIHEFAEAILCQFAGITAAQVDKFDMSEEGLGCDEPGMHKDAPYRKQHLIATGIEMVLAAELGVDWKEYEEYLEDLSIGDGRV